MIHTKVLRMLFYRTEISIAYASNKEKLNKGSLIICLNKQFPSIQHTYNNLINYLLSLQKRFIYKVWYQNYEIYNQLKNQTQNCIYNFFKLIINAQHLDAFHFDTFLKKQLFPNQSFSPISHNLLTIYK